MGDQDTPGQRSLDSLATEARYAELPYKVGDLVTFVTYPALIGRDGIIVLINTRNDFPYTVELAGGDIVYCGDDDLAPAS